MPFSHTVSRFIPTLKYNTITGPKATINSTIPTKVMLTEDQSPRRKTGVFTSSRVATRLCPRYRMHIVLLLVQQYTIQRRSIVRVRSNLSDSATKKTQFRCLVRTCRLALCITTGHPRGFVMGECVRFCVGVLKLLLSSTILTGGFITPLMERASDMQRVTLKFRNTR